MSDAQSDFDIAKAISELLSGKDKERQHRVLRWVAESLEITLQAQVSTSPELPVPLSGNQAHSELLALPRNAPNIKTFMDNKKPKSDVQFATATAYFYRFEAPPEQRKDSISAEVLQDAARLASRARFAQPAMTLTNAKNQGYLDQAGRGAYSVNSVGENLVAMTLPSTNETSLASKRPAKKKANGKRNASAKKKTAAKPKR